VTTIATHGDVAAPPSALAVRALAKHYGDLRAVDGVTFDVNPGEIFGLLGPNGAGKTTTIECILGLRHPDAGSITIAGVDVQSEPNRIKQLVGAQLQTTALQEKITPQEALSFFGSFYANAIKPHELLERFALTDKAGAPFDSLSGGQRQRLALALAFVNDPAVLVLDEPTAGLDPAVRRELHGEIRRIRQMGRSVLLTTHYIEEAEQLCDRVAIIDHGRIVAAGTPAELIGSSKIPARVIVRTQGPIDPTLVRSVPAVIDAEQSDGSWQLSTSDATRTIIELLRTLESQRNELLDLEVRRASLEDVFLELTGERFDGAEHSLKAQTT
jgi:ABC-2 type transport system ATP-binding protein